jgi:transposase
MYDKAGLELVYLPLYFPELDSIEEFFAGLEAFIKRHWQIYEADPKQGFAPFFE